MRHNICLFCIFIILAQSLFSQYDSEIKLQPSGLQLNDAFGSCVVIDGAFAYVGVTGDDFAANNGGSVYVYQWNGTDWQYNMTYYAYDAYSADNWGGSMDASGGYLAVGCKLDDDLGTNSGSIYIYLTNGGTLTFFQKLTAPDGITSDLFGSKVAFSGDLLAVSAPQCDVDSTDCGAVYVFRFNGTDWQFESKLYDPDRNAGDQLGYSLDISGNTIIAGVIYDDDSGSGAGSACIFSDQGSGFSFHQKITPAQLAASDNFGCSVTIYGNTLVTGAYKDDDQGTDAGVLYVYRESGGTWLYDTILHSDATAYDWFGVSCHMNDSILVAGAPMDNGGRGSMHIFRWDNQSFTFLQKVTSATIQSNDNLGFSVCTNGFFTAAGVSGDDHDISAIVNTGSVSIFRKIPLFPCYQDSVLYDLCDGDSIYAGGNWQYYNGCFTDTFSTLYGCDSLLVHCVSFHPEYSSTDSIAICQGDSIYAGGSFQYLAGLYTDSLLTGANCDSIIFTFLDVTTVPPAPFLIQSNDTLFTGSCSEILWFLNDTLITGFQDTFLVPVQDGYYYVICSENNCLSDTSNHIQFVLSGVRSYYDRNPSVYPVPACTGIYVRFSYPPVETIFYSLHDISGILHLAGELSISPEETIWYIPFENTGPGLYILNIRSAGMTFSYKIAII
ncbi:MAG: hypothetical protein ABIJ16_00400 [Bacteroidota bacterium]